MPPPPNKPYSSMLPLLCGWGNVQEEEEEGRKVVGDGGLRGTKAWVTWRRRRRINSPPLIRRRRRWAPAAAAAVVFILAVPRKENAPAAAPSCCCCCQPGGRSPPWVGGWVAGWDERGYVVRVRWMDTRVGGRRRGGLGCCFVEREGSRRACQGATTRCRRRWRGAWGWWMRGGNEGKDQGGRRQHRQVAPRWLSPPFIKSMGKALLSRKKG